MTDESRVKQQSESWARTAARDILRMTGDDVHGRAAAVIATYMESAVRLAAPESTPAAPERRMVPLREVMSLLESHSLMLHLGPPAPTKESRWAGDLIDNVLSILSKRYPPEGESTPAPTPQGIPFADFQSKKDEMIAAVRRSEKISGADLQQRIGGEPPVPETREKETSR